MKAFRYTEGFKYVPTIEITRRGLGKNCLGLCRRSGKIIIHPDQPPREFFDTAVHELLHRYQPDMSEARVSALATFIVGDLWALGFRRVIL
jgi:hypothetical protein